METSLEIVYTFVYLGNTLSRNGSVDVDIPWNQERKGPIWNHTEAEAVDNVYIVSQGR